MHPSTSFVCALPLALSLCGGGGEKRGKIKSTSCGGNAAPRMYVVGKAMARAIGEDVMPSQLDIREDRKRTYQSGHPTFSARRASYMGLAEHDEHGEHGRGGCGLQLWYSSSLNGAIAA